MRVNVEEYQLFGHASATVGKLGSSKYFHNVRLGMGKCTKVDCIL